MLFGSIIATYAGVQEKNAKLDLFLIELYSVIQDNKYDKAIQMTNKAIEIKKNISGESSQDKAPYYAILYFKMAELQLHVGRKDKALEYLVKLCGAEGRFIPRELQRNLIILLDGLANKDIHTQRYKRAVVFQKKTVELSKLLFGEKSRDYAILLNELAGVYYEAGKYSEALKTGKKSYALMRDVAGENDFGTLKAKLNLGTYYMNLGHYEKAVKYQQSAIKTSEMLLGNNNDIIASMYNTVSLTYIRQGNYIKAKYYLDKAIKIKEILNSKDSSLVKIYNHTAYIYQELGNPKEALLFYQKALRLFDVLSSNDKKLKVAIYNNMAQVYMDSGTVDKSISYYEKVLAISDENHPDIAFVYGNLGFLHTLQEHHKIALDFLQKSMTLKKKLLAQNHPSLVYAYLNMSNLYDSMSDEKKSLEYAKKALGVLKYNKEENNHYLMEVSHANIAYAYSKMGKPSKAYTFIDKAFSYFKKVKESAYAMTSQKEKLYFKHSFSSSLCGYFLISYDYALTLKGKDKQNLMVKIFDNWIHIKRSIFNESDNFRLLAQKSKDIQLKKQIATLLANQRKLARMYQKNSTSQKSHTNKKIEIEALQKEIVNSEKYLSKKLRDDVFPVKMTNHKDLAHYLRINELYVDFLKVRQDYYLFTLDYKQKISFYKFSQKETEDIEKNIQDIQKEVYKITSKENFADIKLAYKQYGDLHNLIMGKIAIDNKTSLIISPDGLLDLLSFEALYDRKTKKYLMEKITIKYLSSANDLRKSNKRSMNSSDDVVIFANPNYESSTGTKKEVRGEIFQMLKPNFSLLPGSKKEALDIKNIFTKSKLYLEENATEINLMKVKSPKILHIATHGFFIDKQLEWSPLLKTGIVLSGANASIRMKTGRGILTGLELAGLSLGKTDLVVLSSCYSGLGDIEEGEGMASLSDAFRKAGVKNVLMSLWSVNDKLGAKMMKTFYENIKNKKPYSEALREAKLKMIKEGYVHPYYWGGFMMNGAGR